MVGLLTALCALGSAAGLSDSEDAILYRRSIVNTILRDYDRDYPPTNQTVSVVTEVMVQDISEISDVSNTFEVT